MAKRSFFEWVGLAAATVATFTSTLGPYAASGTEDRAGSDLEIDSPEEHVATDSHGTPVYASPEQLAHVRGSPWANDHPRASVEARDNFVGIWFATSTREMASVDFSDVYSSDSGGVRVLIASDACGHAITYSFDYESRVTGLLGNASATEGAGQSGNGATESLSASASSGSEPQPPSRFPVPRQVATASERRREEDEGTIGGHLIALARQGADGVGGLWIRYAENGRLGETRARYTIAVAVRNQIRSDERRWRRPTPADDIGRVNARPLQGPVEDVENLSAASDAWHSGEEFTALAQRSALLERYLAAEEPHYAEAVRLALQDKSLDEIAEALDEEHATIRKWFSRRIQPRLIALRMHAEGRSCQEIAETLGTRASDVRRWLPKAA